MFYHPDTRIRGHSRPQQLWLPATAMLRRCPDTNPIVLSKKVSPQWILEGDIKGCFDHISHAWMTDNLCMDKVIMIKAGKKLLTDVVQTTKEPASIWLTSFKKSLTAGCDDIAILTMEALDKNNLAVPTAGNEITFAIQGPGKIIGVGNGDPTSLEKDRFIEAFEIIKIENLKEKAVDSLDVMNETGMTVDDTNWKEAFKDRDYKKLAKAYVIAAALC